MKENTSKQNRNVHISVLIGVLWDMGQIHCVICVIALFHVFIQIQDVLSLKGHHLKNTHIKQLGYIELNWKSLGWFWYLFDHNVSLR